MLSDEPYSSIGIFGHYGNRNLGDEAIITAVIYNVKLRLPNARIVGFSLKPADTAERYEIPAYPIRKFPQNRSRRQPTEAEREAEFAPTSSNAEPDNERTARKWVKQVKAFIKKMPLGKALIQGARALVWAVPMLIAETRFLRKSYKILQGIDLLMITGSNQLMDNFGGCNDGPWGFPYTLLKWGAMAKLTGTKIAYVSVGAGPITSKLSKAMIRLALRLSDYTSFRDERSQKLIESLGVKGETAVFPDLAYSLFCGGESDRGQLIPARTGKPAVGINPMPVYDNEYWYIHDAEKYGNYVKKLATFSAVLLREGYPLTFWSTQPKDQDVITDILVYLETELGVTGNARELISTARTVEELVKIVDSFDIVVATRFHGVVLSLFSEAAVLSICYHKKMDDVMKEMGQSDYSVMFDSLDAEDLMKRFKRLERNMEPEVEKIKHKIAENRFALARQYDELFGAPM